MGRHGHVYYTYTYATPAHGGRRGHASSRTSGHVAYTHGAYTIKRGDTMSKIAAHNGTTVNRLCQVTAFQENATLKPGHKLKLK